MTTLQKVNRALAESERPHIRLRRGKGYYYIYSDNPAQALEIAALRQSGIYVYSISSYSVQEWLTEIALLFPPVK